MAEADRQYDSKLRYPALIACARAANAWRQRSAPDTETLDPLMTALEVLARMYRQRSPVTNLPGLLDAFVQPLDRIHPDGDSQPLLSITADGIELTEYGRLLLSTLEELPERKALQEVIQAVLQRARERHATDPDAASQTYVAFRLYVIEHPLAEQFDLMEALSPQGCKPNQLYCPILSDRVVPVGSSRLVYPCPSCHWPMPYRHDRMACSAQACIDHGAVFHLTEGCALKPLSTLEPPASVKLTGDLMMATEATWQYIVRPGQSELELFRQLGNLEGVERTLWPEVDRFDLLIQRGGRKWFVDVKDQAYPRLLAIDLGKRKPDREIVIAVPDSHASQTKWLKGAVENSRYRFMTFTELYREVEATPPTEHSEASGDDA